MKKAQGNLGEFWVKLSNQVFHNNPLFKIDMFVLLSYSISTVPQIFFAAPIELFDDYPTHCTIAIKVMIGIFGTDR